MGGLPTEWWTDEITFEQIEELYTEMDLTLERFHRKHNLRWDKEEE